jgi:cell division protein FtsW (lipid II flippase)
LSSGFRWWGGLSDNFWRQILIWYIFAFLVINHSHIDLCWCLKPFILGFYFFNLVLLKVLPHAHSVNRSNSWMWLEDGNP